MLLAVSEAIVDGVLGRGIPVAIDVRGAERSSPRRPIVNLGHA